MRELSIVHVILTMSQAAVQSLSGSQRLLHALSALRHRNYRLYWFGQLSSVLAQNMEGVAQGWLVPGALVIVERAAKRSQVVWPDGIVEDRTKKYGETALWYGHATPAP